MPALIRVINETPGSIVILREANGRNVTIRGGENGTGAVLVAEPVSIECVQDGWPEPTPAPTPAPSLLSRLIGG